MDRTKHINEGWTVGDFIDSLEPTIDLIMRGESWREKIKTKKEMKEWCMEDQPYYKKHIPEVVDYFAEKYNLK